MKILGPVLAAHYLAAFTALGMPVFMPRVLAELAPGAPNWLAGVLYVLPTIFTALTSTAWGRIADRHGRKLSLMRAQLGLAFGFTLAGFAPSLPWFILALVVQGSCGGSLAAANAYLSTQSQGKSLSRALDWTQFSARLAMVTAPVLLGLMTGSGMAQNIYRYLALLPVIALGLTWFLPTDVIDANQVQTIKTGVSGAEQNGRFQLGSLLAVQFLFYFAMVVTFPYFIPYSERIGVGSDSLAGMLYSLPHLVYLILLPCIQLVLVNYGRSLPLGLFLLAVACLSHGVLSHMLWLVPARVLYGVGMLLGFSGINRMLSVCIARAPAGRLFGSFDACGKWAGALGGVTAGFLVHRYGLAMPFLVAAGASTLAAATSMVLSTK